jgi:hypothetical protein
VFVEISADLLSVKYLLRKKKNICDENTKIDENTKPPAAFVLVDPNKKITKTVNKYLSQVPIPWCHATISL